MSMFIGDAEFVYELLSPRFVFHVGFHFEIELGVKGGTVHVEVTASRDGLAGDSPGDVDLVDSGGRAGQRMP